MKEKGEIKQSANFKDLDAAVEAGAAKLAWRRNALLEDARSIFDEDATNKLSREEIDYWTYVYFNVGVVLGRTILERRKSAAIRKWRKHPEDENTGGSPNAHLNALIRIATAEYLRCTGVFRSGREECLGEKAVRGHQSADSDR